MLVCGSSAKKLDAYGFLEQYGSQHGIEIVRFSDFAPNPDYDSVVKGVRIFREKQCDSIIAIGGGSAMDVAKCIRLYYPMDGNGEDGSYLTQEKKPSDIPLLVVPTTAGTGSEATRYAVIYYKRQKQSITEDRLPDIVLLDSGALKSLPVYQRKATMLDVLSHAIESYWSIRSTEESKKNAEKAIALFLQHKGGYLNNTEEGNTGMLRAANVAGKAINITQTAAGHAMCYKITSLFGCAHGHAAGLCNRVLYGWMAENTDKCIDPRGEAYLRETFDRLGRLLGGKNGSEGAAKLRMIIDSLDLEVPVASEEQFAVLRRSVNPVRLKNTPVNLDEETIDILYRRILREKA